MQEKADIAGLTVPHMLHDLALGLNVQRAQAARIEQMDRVDTVHQLQRIGKNLNQAVKLAEIRSASGEPIGLALTGVNALRADVAAALERVK